MFTKTLLIASFLFTALPNAGCSDEVSPEKNTYPGTINSETLSDFDDAQSCDAETPCPVGLECMYVGALELETPICVDAATICEAINCGEGECLMLESYPGQVMCSSGDDGDNTCTTDSSGTTVCLEDCTVSSDGTTVCPEDCTVSSDGSISCPEAPGEEEGSEPGDSGNS